MKLNLDRLTETPVSLSFDCDGAWWADRNEAVQSADHVELGVVEFATEAHIIGANVYLEGGMSGDVEVECSRCIARYRHGLRDDYRLVLEPARERIPSDPEGVETLAHDGLWLGDDLEIGWYRGSELRLDGFFAEIISLAIPVQPLCKDDCAGLCHSCGENRNTVVCGCGEARPNSPFAALAALRGGGTGGKL